MRNLSVLALLVALLSPVLAQGVTGNGEPVNWPLSTYRNVTQLQGTPVNPSNVTRFNWPAAGGGLFTDATVRIPQPNGQTLAVVPRAPILPSAAAAALGNFAKKVVPAVVLASALKDLATDLGFLLKDQGGALVVERVGDRVCTPTACYEFRISTWGGPEVWFSTPAQACSAAAAQLTAVTPSVPAGYSAGSSSFTPPSTGFSCTVIRNDTGSPTVVSGSARSLALSPPSMVPSSVDELQAAISSDSSLGSRSATRPAIIQAINSGESLTTGAPTSITGPTTTPGSVSTTINNTNNTTTTTTTTNNHTYNGPNVTTTTTTTLVTINNITNEVIRSETTTDEPLLPQPPPAPDPLPLPEPFEMPCGIAGTPPCGVKIDESGMPPIPPNPYSQAQDELDSVKSSTQTAIDAVTNDVVLPEWSWTFQLPTGCAPLPLEGYGLSLDICKFKPVIHDLMSLLWVAAGIFGLLGLARSAFEG